MTGQVKLHDGTGRSSRVILRAVRGKGPSRVGRCRGCWVRTSGHPGAPGAPRSPRAPHVASFWWQADLSDKPLTCRLIVPCSEKLNFAGWGKGGEAEFQSNSFMFEIGRNLSWGIKANFSRQFVSSLVIIWSVRGTAGITCFLFKNKHEK